MDTHSFFKLHMGVATPSFKWASQKVRGAEWEWRKGSCPTLERWRWQARALSRWSEWKGVSLGSVHHTYNILRGDGTWQKPSFEHLWCHCHQRSGGRCLNFSGSRFHVYVWVMQKRGFWQKVEHPIALFFSVTGVDWLGSYDSTIQLLKLFSSFKQAETVLMLQSCCALNRYFCCRFECWQQSI